MKIAALSLALALSLNINPAVAADEGSAALIAMGEVNGTALACQQMAIVSRARNAVATTAPKTRANGEIFEEATNSNFLAFGKDKKTCPDAGTLAQRLNDAEKRLSAAFAQK